MSKKINIAIIGLGQIGSYLYKEILKTNPKHVDAHNNLGIVFKELGEHKKAKRKGSQENIGCQSPR